MSQFIEMFGCLAERVALSSLCDTFIDGDWIEAKDQSGSGIRLIQTGNVGVGTFKDKGDRARYISEETFNRLNCTEVVEGDILISRLPEPVGRACIIPAGLGKSITAVDCTIIRLNDKVLPKFFVAFTNTPDYAMQIKKVLSGTTRLRVSRANLGKIQVPLPSIDKQQQFVTIAEQADKSGFDGRKSQFIEMFGNPLSQVQRYPLEKLGDCCVLNPRRPSISLSDTDMVSFVPMPCVSENGYLQDVADEESGKVKKGFTYFENKDVLFAKITPCMENGKGAIAQELTNGIGMGSTEFHVLRPIEGKSNSYWLLALTRMPIFREQASKNMSGTGGQKRVGASFLDNFMVGLPPIEEQNRFERIYRQADKSGSGGRESVALMDKVKKSLINYYNI